METLKMEIQKNFIFVRSSRIETSTAQLIKQRNGLQAKERWQALAVDWWL